MSVLECPVCGVTAIEKPNDMWQIDEELDCPGCGTRLQVEINAEETEVWLREVED